MEPKKENEMEREEKERRWCTKKRNDDDEEGSNISMNPLYPTLPLE